MDLLKLWLFFFITTSITWTEARSSYIDVEPGAGLQSVVKLPDAGFFGFCREFRLFSRGIREAETTVESGILLDSSPRPDGYAFSMVLVEEYSDNRCFSGSTYGYEITGSIITIYALYGCRAMFSVCEYVDDDNETCVTEPKPDKLICKSIRLRSTPSEPAKRVINEGEYGPVYIVSFRLDKLFSKTPCREWQNAYAYGATVETRDGCEGQFTVCYQTYGYAEYEY